MEQMVNCQLVWILKSWNILPNCECGNGKHRFTIDHFVNPEHYHAPIPDLSLHRLVEWYYLAMWCSENPPQVESEESATDFYLFWLQGPYFRVYLANVLCLLWRNCSVVGIGCSCAVWSHYQWHDLTWLVHLFLCHCILTLLVSQDY